MPQFDLFELFHQFFFVFWAFIYTFLLVEGFVLPSVFKVIKSRRFCTNILPEYYWFNIKILAEYFNFFLISNLHSCNVLLESTLHKEIIDRELRIND